MHPRENETKAKESEEAKSVLRIDVLTIFPGLFSAFFEESIVGIAQQRGKVRIRAHDVRDWATDRHRTVDDIPYGGGAGMLMKPEPLVAAIEAVAGPKGPEREGRVILLCPQGRRLDQRVVEELAQQPALTLVCGRYEGVDQRVIDLAVDEELSIGDYILCGGEAPAMVLIEAVVRLVPGVLGNPASLETESFRGPMLEGPQYTRPAVFRGLEVPAVLRSGDHAAVARWREAEALRRTVARRPDLLVPGPVGGDDGESKDFPTPEDRSGQSDRVVSQAAKAAKKKAKAATKAVKSRDSRKEQQS